MACQSLLGHVRALESEIGQEILTDAVSRMDDILKKIIKEDAEPQEIPDYSQEDTITVTLSVDHEIWGKFMSRLREMYSKHKLQSEIVNIILTDYLGDE